jgi:catechol 2,3-dioxygenase-like lactoylglutathione lyase family enzyme
MYRAMIVLAGCAFTATAFCAEPAALQGADANGLGLFIDHASIGVADIAKETEWYRRVLGFQLGETRHRPTREVQVLLMPGFRLDLIADKGSVRPAATDVPKQGLLKITFGTKDPEATYKRLAALGADMRVTRDAQGKVTNLNVNDPEGNTLEISQR